MWIAAAKKPASEVSRHPGGDSDSSSPPPAKRAMVLYGHRTEMSAVYISQSGHGGGEDALGRGGGAADADTDTAAAIAAAIAGVTSPDAWLGGVSSGLSAVSSAAIASPTITSSGAPYAEGEEAGPSTAAAASTVLSSASPSTPAAPATPSSSSPPPSTTPTASASSSSSSSPSQSEGASGAPTTSSRRKKKSKKKSRRLRRVSPVMHAVEGSLLVRGASGVSTLGVDIFEASSGFYMMETLLRLGEAQEEESYNDHMFLSHPFYRLPVLDEGVRTAPLMFQGSCGSSGRLGRVHQCLLTLHYLLLEKSWSEEEAMRAIASAAYLGEFLLGKHTNPLSSLSPFRASYLLGRRYIIFDALFSTIQVLGAPEETLQSWKALIKEIPFALSFRHRRDYGEQFGENLQLCYRLYEALTLLKDGVRPSPKETVYLKRAILYNMPSTDFGTPKYDPWRDADSEWNKENENRMRMQ